MRTKQTQVNMHEAKTHLSSLVARSARGEKIVIARDGVPVARLVSIKKPGPRRRSFGRLKGKITMRDDFCDPLSEAELESMFGDAAS